MRDNASLSSGGRRSVIVPAVLGALILAALGYYLFQNAEQYARLVRLSAAGLLGLAGLSLLFPVLNGIQNTLLYRSLGVAGFTHADGFLISATSSLANQLPVPGGILSKGYYLKRRHSLPYALFAGSTLALFVCFLSLNGFIGLAVLLYWAGVQRAEVPAALWLGFSLMAACLLVFALPLERLKMPARMQGRTRGALQGWHHLVRHPYVLLRIMCLQGILVLLLAARYVLAFRMLSQNISFLQVLLMSSVSILTQVVSLAPGGLGVREVLVGGLGSLLGFGLAISVGAITLDRLVSTAVKALAGGISTVVLSRMLAGPTSGDERGKSPP